MSPRDLRILATYEVTRLFRSPHGLIALLIFASFYAWVGVMLHVLAREIGSRLAAEGSLDMDQVINMLGGLAPAAARDVLTTHPPILVAAFGLAIAVTPFLAMVVAADQTGSDIRSRHLRFLLLRTNRLSVYIGRALGVLVAFALLQAVALGAMTAAIGLDAFPTAAEWLYMGRIYLASLALAVPFIALMALANALVATPLRSLALVLALQITVAIIASLGDGAMEPAAYAFPSALKYHLISNAPADLARTLGFQLAYAAAALSLGFVVFRRRDV